MRRATAHGILLATLALVVPSLAGGATFTLVNGDGPNEGFNDPTPVAPVGGNPGTTLGEQRRNAFAHATGLWWHQQRKGPAESSFVRFDFFPHPAQAAKLPKTHDLSAEELALVQEMNKGRADQKRAPWKIHPELCVAARVATRAGVESS